MRWEDARKGGRDVCCNKKNGSSYSEAEKSNFNIGKDFPAASPALDLKGLVYERLRIGILN